MKYIKMFIAGIAFPSTLLPFALFVLQPPLLMVSFVHFIALIWGIWNILYFVLFAKFLPGNATVKMLVTGALLGVLLAIYGVFWLQLPILLGFPESLYYAPLIIVPILYALVWAFVVHPINRLLGNH